MLPLFRRLALVAVLPVVLAGCEEIKSSNPLSPTVAGPMAGVSISVPLAVAPGAGNKIEDSDQPIALVVKNPDSNSERPVVIGLEVAFDSAFQSIAFSRQGLAPDPSGQTTVRLDRLPSGRVYYWHAKADDGANGSGWSGTLSFEILNPIVIGVPTPKSPIGGATAGAATPDLVVTNAKSSGPYSILQYQFQVSDTQTFANLVVNGSIYEEPNADTHMVTPAFTQFDTLFFWRVRATDGKHTGDWSRVESFRTPKAPVIVPVTPVGGGGGGGSSLDVSACNALVSDKSALSKCIHDTINPGPSADLAFEVTKRIAWALRGEGAGLLIKNGGENTYPWKGYSFSLSRICYPDGHIWKVLSDAGQGGTNGWSWADNDFVDKSLYVPAINPN
jgi:hypothetical protein